MCLAVRFKPFFERLMSRTWFLRTLFFWALASRRTGTWVLAVGVTLGTQFFSENGTRQLGMVQAPNSPVDGSPVRPAAREATLGAHSSAPSTGTDPVPRTGSIC